MVAAHRRGRVLLAGDVTVHLGDVLAVVEAPVAVGDVVIAVVAQGGGGRRRGRRQRWWRHRLQVGDVVELFCDSQLSVSSVLLVIRGGRKDGSGIRRKVRKMQVTPLATPEQYRLKGFLSVILKELNG